MKSPMGKEILIGGINQLKIYVNIKKIIINKSFLSAYLKSLSAENYLSRVSLQNSE